MSDEELISYLSASGDLDDQSLVARFRLVAELKAKVGPLKEREMQFLAVASRINRRELAFLKRSSAYRISHGRPCWPRWDWWPLLFEDEDGKLIGGRRTAER